MWHKAFIRWIWAQDNSSDTPSIPKDALGPIGIPLKRGTTGDKATPSKEVYSLGIQPLKLKEKVTQPCDMNAKPPQHLRQAASANWHPQKMPHQICAVLIMNGQNVMDTKILDLL